DNYVGYVTSTSVTGSGRTFHYAVPTAREAGMWSPAGPVQGGNGHVYVASGNGAELHGRWDKSDSVTELSTRRLHRLSVFAPATGCTSPTATPVTWSSCGSAPATWPSGSMPATSRTSRPRSPTAGTCSSRP